MTRKTSAVLALVGALLWVVGAATSAAQTTERVSVSSAGEQGNGDSFAGEPSWSLSANGRYVAFVSAATNLVSGDTNGLMDVFVHDRQIGITERVSVSSAGGQGNYHSVYPSISADGRLVAFESSAYNLVSGDTNNTDDVFVHDRQSGVTERASVDSAGGQGNGTSEVPSVSADGLYVAFDSMATNLVSGDTNGTNDVFVHDRTTGITERVSVDSAGGQGNDTSGYATISADGRYVAFNSMATNLVSGDTNGWLDVFVHDRQTGITERVSVDSAGGQGNGDSWVASISADGRYVAFTSYATNLVSGDSNGCEDIFVHDLQTGVTTWVSVDSSGGQGNNWSEYPSISADGRYVAFDSVASNLVSGDTNGHDDVFVHDLQTGTTTLASVSSSGVVGNNNSGSPSLSGDGRYVAFNSMASNLVSGDTNSYTDVFVRGPLDCLFCDGFESGDTSAWSQVVP